MIAPDETYRQGERLAGSVAMDLYDDFWAKSRHRFGNPADDYELLGSDEAEALGGPGDDPYWTALRRKSDGQVFEIEIEVTARPITAPPPRQEIPGQMTLAEVTP